MHDFYCTDAKDIKNRKLAKRVKFFKEDEEGVKIMSNVFEEIKNENTREIVKNLIAVGVDDNKILESTHLSKHVLEKLKKEVEEESNNLKAV